MVGGTEGADARARWEFCSRGGLDLLMGMAGAVAVEGPFVSFDGDEDSPAGDPMEEGKMKSSRFMASACCVCSCWSMDCLNCAMPLGADVLGVDRPSVALVGGGPISLCWDSL